MARSVRIAVDVTVTGLTAVGSLTVQPGSRPLPVATIRACWS
jgi:hypothetical protein